jgi:hypothetical protein
MACLGRLQKIPCECRYFINVSQIKSLFLILIYFIKHISPIFPHLIIQQKRVCDWFFYLIFNREQPRMQNGTN